MKEKLKELLQEIVGENIGVEVEVPKDPAMGDFSSSIAMKIAKNEGKNPRDVANEIVSKINIADISKIEIAGPGFINFYLKNDYLIDNLKEILSSNEYGKRKLSKKETINLEYVSANPTGTLHMGHARGAAYGDSLARILDYVGYDVTREYYINDGGNQINNLILSIEARYKELKGENFVMPEDGYYGGEIIEIAAKMIADNQEPSQVNLRHYGLEYLLKNIKDDLKKFGVEFDVWSSEQKLYDTKEVEKTLQSLIGKGVTYSFEDATWLKTSEYGDEKDRVLVKNDHSNTYLLPDIAYHVNKYLRNYDRMVDVFGADHHGYVARIKAGVSMMGYDSSKLSVKILQMVKLVKGSEEIKMSKRTGNSVTLHELMEEVGVDPIRYSFISKSLDSQMTFDIELATKKTNENPVYYIQYANARIKSILNNNKIMGEADYNTYTEQSINILKKLNEFKSVLADAAQKMTPHILANYLYDLATIFHNFYNNEKVLSDDEKYTIDRINLIKAVSTVITTGLMLIGVSAPDKM